jgi:hypothetical protein
MPYCPRCGVEIEMRLEACPLCGTAIPGEVRDGPPEPADYPDDVIPPQRMYKTLDQRQKKLFATLMVCFLGLFPIAYTLGMDLIRNGHISWSFFVAIPVVGAALLSLVFMRLGHHPFIAVTVALILLGAVSLLLIARALPDRRLGRHLLPYYSAVFFALESALAYIVFRRPSWLRLVIVLLILGTGLTVAVDIIATDRPDWSFITAAATLPASFFFFYLDRVRRKGINLAGFLCFDLAVMLAALNYAISGGIGWSSVTALILGTVGVLFYILHVSLFNGTDWKKALHL